MGMLDDIQVGDKVLFISQFGGVSERVVSRTTKTRIYVSGSDLAFTRDGREIGAPYHRCSEITRFNQEKLDTYHAYRAEKAKKAELTRRRDAVAKAVEKLSDEEINALYERYVEVK